MDEQINYRQMAVLIFEAMNKRDFADVQPYLSDEVVLNFPGSGDVAGARKVVVFMKTLLRKFPQLQFTVYDVVVENNKAVVFWTNKGTNAQGESYANSGNTLVRFQENRISFISDYFKDTSFLRT